MSDFFGFNTVLPDRQGAGRPSFNPQEQQELERRVQEYAIETGEDFEIYDYGETYDNLADELEETRDDQNDETFGPTSSQSTVFLFLMLFRLGRGKDHKVAWRLVPRIRNQSLIIFLPC